ncbi:hypothetical protein GCM10027026_13020 [Myroides odoratimimus subsp. xuanwuensis]
MPAAPTGQPPGQVLGNRVTLHTAGIDIDRGHITGETSHHSGRTTLLHQHQGMPQRLSIADLPLTGVNDEPPRRLKEAPV